jgi:hypothetical protein
LLCGSRTDCRELGSCTSDELRPSIEFRNSLVPAHNARPKNNCQSLFLRSLQSKENQTSLGLRPSRPTSRVPNLPPLHSCERAARVPFRADLRSARPPLRYGWEIPLSLRLLPPAVTLHSRKYACLFTILFRDLTALSLH